MNFYILIIPLYFFCLVSHATQISDSTSAPLKIYKQALYIIENSKEYKMFKKEHYLKKEKYVVSSEIEDFQIYAFFVRNIQGVHFDLLSDYENGYTDDSMQRLSQVEEGRILIYFSNIDHDFFTVSIYWSKKRIKNPKVKDASAYSPNMLFLFKCEESKVKYVLAGEILS